MKRQTMTVMKNLRTPFQPPLQLPAAENGAYLHPSFFQANPSPAKPPIDYTAIVVATQEAERKKIAEELHDNICQTLGAIKLFIDQMLESNRLKRSTIRKCSLYLHEVINELRHISHNMGMVWLQEHHFSTALQKFVAMMQELKKINIRLQIDGFNDNCCNQYTQLILFRIIQEQVQNVLKHARATEICITLKNSGASGYLSVSDNGIGANILDPSIKEGAGLKNIRHRVEIIAGCMEITTEPGKGFKVEVQFPVNNLPGK